VATGTLREGARGPEVRSLQEQLIGEGYWIGTASGTFDDATHHAVVALQKTYGLQRDGVVGPNTRAALASASRIVPQSTDGTVFEIDLDRQLLLQVHDGATVWVFDTSTGSRAGSTPRGHWEVYWQYDGYQHGSLGTLYRPKYFNGNVSIHGYPNVPSTPASHGCVRVTNETMDFLWETNALPIGTRVWVY
jgi:lipoprotein-anchoring transpeptidase ErfK/SrfK